MESVSRRIKAFFTSERAASSQPTHGNPNPPSIFQENDLGKAILNLAFSATIALVTFLNHQPSAMQSDPPLALLLLAVTILIAFSSSFLALSLSRSYPTCGRALEHVGVVSTVVAFFLLMCFLLPSGLNWVVLVACVLSLTMYIAAHVKGLHLHDGAAIEERQDVGV